MFHLAHMKSVAFSLAIVLVCVVALVPVHADEPFVKSFGCYKDGAWQAHCTAVIGLAGLTGPTSVNVNMTEYVDGKIWNSHIFTYVTYTWAYTASDTFSLVGMNLGDHQIYAIMTARISSGIPPIQTYLSAQTPTTTISVG